jgi:hypothetical protein
MCERCENINKRLYPDLGEGAELHIREIRDTILNAPHAMNMIRIVQDRTVDYMGPEGVEVRTELHAVYIPYETLLELILDLGQIYTEKAPHDVKVTDAMKMHISGWFDNDT